MQFNFRFKWQIAARNPKRYTSDKIYDSTVQRILTDHSKNI